MERAQRRPARSSLASPPAAVQEPSAPLPAAPTPASGPLASGEDDQARTRAALQRLGACADFSANTRERAGCGQAWSDRGAKVEPLSTAQRAAFGAITPDERIQSGVKVRDALINHDSHGNHVNYGCTWSGGKRTCSTY